MMTLIQGEPGKTYRVYDIRLDKLAERRFQILGMTRGADVSVLNKKRSGSVIIKIRGTRFAVGKSFAEGIWIGGEKHA